MKIYCWEITLKFNWIYPNIIYYIDNPAYVAIGLSSDDKMGDDSVMECIPEGGTIRAYTSWTSPPPNYGATRDGVVSVINKNL